MDLVYITLISFVVLIISAFVHGASLDEEQMELLGNGQNEDLRKTYSPAQWSILYLAAFSFTVFICVGSYLAIVTAINLIINFGG